jgi:predicted RNase H-like nuclease (RuvC/YqgF family)
MENVYSVLITAITVLGGTSAWRYYEKRAEKKDKDEDFIKHDCRDRISKLEALLAESSKEKEQLRQMILDLTSKVAELKVTVDFLRVENEELSKKARTKKVING